MGLEKTELKLRVKAKQKLIEAKIAELKASSASGANEAIQKLQGQLGDLQGQVKQGWEDLTEGAAAKLNNWLADD
jgi:hypothetical protein